MTLISMSATTRFVDHGWMEDNQRNVRSSVHQWNDSSMGYRSQGMSREHLNFMQRTKIPSGARPYMEIDALDNLESLSAGRSRNSHPGDNLHILDVKQDLRREACLVDGRHLVDSLDNNVYSSTVKGNRVQLLHDVIAHKQNVHLLCGGAGNADINFYINENGHSQCSPEFGKDLTGHIHIIKNALYGLRTSS